jgi:hypothetical protein
MHRASKLIALGAVAAVLAACSGTGTTSIPSTAPQSTQGGPTTQSVYPRSEMGSDGHTITYFYNRNIELGGLVTTSPSAGGRTTLSVIPGAMTYHGGPVQTAPKIYVVLWGSASQWGSGDIDGVATYYQNFISGVGGSHWLGSVTQYTQSNGQAVGNAAGSYAGTWNDTVDSVPKLTSPTYQSSLAAEAKRAAAHFGDYSASASYVLMIPHGVRVNGFGSSYCAWHSSTSATGGTIAYTNLPYIPDAGASCGVGSVNSPGTNDGVSIVGGHEQAETETDPQPNTGWLDSGNNENGDKCAWTSLQNDTFSTGSFPTQPLWSNAANGCVR